MFVPRFPLHVVFSLTNRCNLRCIHCSAAAGAPGVGEFSTAEARLVLDQLADLGVVDVALSGGEPLLRRDLEQLVAHAVGRGLRAGTSTSGYYLNAARVASLRQAGLTRLQVSLDGPPAVHEAIRGAGMYERATGAIRLAVAGGLTTHVCFTAMRCNFRHLEAVIDTAAALGAHGFNLSQFVPLGRGTLDMDLDPAATRSVFATWQQGRGRHPEMRFFAHLAGLALVDPAWAGTPGFIGCQAGIHLAAITPSGDVLPCVMFPLVLGNLRQRSFRAIWEEAPAVRTLQARELTGGCGTCALKERCGGCRGAALAYTGDFRGDDPRCWLLHPPPTAAAASTPFY